MKVEEGTIQPFWKKSVRRMLCSPMKATNRFHQLSRMHRDLAASKVLQYDTNPIASASTETLRCTTSKSGGAHLVTVCLHWLMENKSENGTVSRRGCKQLCQPWRASGNSIIRAKQWSAWIQHTYGTLRTKSRRSGLRKIMVATNLHGDNLFQRLWWRKWRKPTIDL